MSRLQDIVKRYLHDRKNYKFFIKNYLELGDLSRAADVMATLRHAGVLLGQVKPAPAKARITIVAPHPDDEWMGPGGTMLQALASGCNVHVVCLTNGATKFSESSPEVESRQNAEIYGYSIEFLNFPANRIALNRATLEAFATAINRSTPDLLWLPFLLDDHDDHRRASHLLMIAALEGYTARKPTVWGYQVYTCLPANIVIDISTVAEEKRTAINRYASQASTRDWSHWALGLNAFNTRFLPGNVGPRFAEVFFELPFQDYVELCGHYFGRPASSCYLTPAYRLMDSEEVI